MKLVPAETLPPVLVKHRAGYISQLLRLMAVSRANGCQSLVVAFINHIEADSDLTRH